jgi:hypothetical protein
VWLPEERASRSSSTALGNTPTTSLRHLSTGALRRAGFDEVYPPRPRAAAVDWSKPVSAGRANASGCVTSSG